MILAQRKLKMEVNTVLSLGVEGEQDSYVRPLHLRVSTRAGAAGRLYIIPPYLRRSRGDIRAQSNYMARLQTCSIFFFFFFQDPGGPRVDVFTPGPQDECALRP